MNKPKPIFSKACYLTDGGLETTLIFDQGIDLPHFAAFVLLADGEGRDALSKYYAPYLEIAGQYNLNFILESPTWRANTDWGFKLGYTQKELNQINRMAIKFMQELKHTAAIESSQVLISGNIGPRGDGYASETIMSAVKAKAYHQPQVNAFAEEKADLITALTLNYSEEAIGISEAAKKAGIPAVISFTVETDGRLPSGESLQEAIEKTDLLTNNYAKYFMINCAHPEHFKEVLEGGGEWKGRIQGLRANASTKSHAELDGCEELDRGDHALLANGYRELLQLLPELKVFGGCCGTDHHHMELICENVLLQSVV